MKVMKILSVLILAVMAGCAAVPSLEELEEQALLTGDWSAVEKRERAMARRQARQGPTCPAGFFAYCEYRVRDELCTCLTRESISMVLTLN
ncbi:MAG: hypothetical protein ACR2QT_01275 [Woeseiaceae bacterium]